MAFKFIYITICFAIAAASYFANISKKDWALLTAGLLFTVIADFFLVLNNNHLPGVAFFCFVHICYIFRVLNAGKCKLSFAQVTLTVVTAAIFFAYIGQALIVLSAIYAALFITNIVVHIWLYRQSDTLLPKLNKSIMLLGIVLFALCDINVLLLNLPRHFDTPVIFPWAFYFIWIFYLPSQFLIAISGIKRQ